MRLTANSKVPKKTLEKQVARMQLVSKEQSMRTNRRLCQAELLLPNSIHVEELGWRWSQLEFILAQDCGEAELG